MEFGIGKIKNVWLVQTFGHSMLKEFVSQFLINVKPMLIMEIALNVIKDMT